MEQMKTKTDLLNSLREYREAPDDENIQYKQKIKETLLSDPCLLYALNEKDLESELFNENGDINWELNEKTGKYEPLGEWDRYFGTTGNIRPFLFIPETQTEVKNFICYQVSFTDTPKYNEVLKYTNIAFTIFVHGKNRMDMLTGIPRHDLIASIIREHFNWSNVFGTQARLISSRESMTDNNYVTRTLIFELIDTNGIYSTKGKKTSIINYGIKR